MKTTTTEKRTLRAVVFVAIVIMLLAVFSCSKPTERVIRSGQLSKYVEKMK